MEITCECCRKGRATVRDYRETKYGYNKYLVCMNCITKPDNVFFMQMGRTNKKIKEKVK